MDMVGSMISYSTLQLSLWMEALKTAIHILNEYQASQCPKHHMSCGQEGNPHLTTYVCGVVQLRLKYLTQTLEN